MEPTERRRSTDLDPDPEMWEALGEGRLLSAILEEFYTAVYADPRLAHFFEGTSRDRAVEKQWSFLCQIFTGRDVYFGDRPRNAHHWMVISDELFDHREALMERCLRAHGLPEHLVARWMRMENRFRKQIVKDAPRPKKIRGTAVPFEGYEPLVLDVGTLCDGCQGELGVGSAVRYHVRTGRTYGRCCDAVVDGSAALGAAS